MRKGGSRTEETVKDINGRLLTLSAPAPNL